MEQRETATILNSYEDLGRGIAQTPEQVERMMGLHRLRWGTRRIATELGVSRNTVRHYVRAGGWRAYKTPKRPQTLRGLELWLAEQYRTHRNAAVIQQELVRIQGIQVSLRTVQRAVAGLRRTAGSPTGSSSGGW